MVWYCGIRIGGRMGRVVEGWLGLRRAQVNYLSLNPKNFVGDLSGTLARYLRAIAQCGRPSGYRVGMNEPYVVLLATLGMNIFFRKGPDREDLGLIVYKPLSYRGCSKHDDQQYFN